MKTLKTRVLALAALGLSGLTGASPALAGNATQLWATVHTGPAYYGVASDPGRVFAAGRIPNPISGDFDFVVDAFNPANGSLLWRTRTDDGGDETAGWWKGGSNFLARDPIVNNVIATQGGRVFAVGASCPFGVCTKKFDQFAFSLADTAVVRAYDGQTGSILWEHVDGPGEGAAEAVAADSSRVYVGDLHSLRAFGAVNGKLIWTQSHNFVPAAPQGVARMHQILVVGNRVFAVFGGTEDGFRVRAYNRSNGAVVWDDSFRLDSFQGSAQTMSYAGGRLFVGGFVDLNNDNKLAEENWVVRAYDASTGALLWQDGSIQLYGQAYGSAAIAGVVTFAGVENTNSADKFFVRTYDQATGQLLWQDEPNLGATSQAHTVAAQAGRTISRTESGAPGLTQGLILVGGSAEENLSAYKDATLRAYNPKTGSLVWLKGAGLTMSDEDFLSLETRAASVYVVGTSSPDSDVMQNGLVAAYKTN